MVVVKLVMMMAMDEAGIRLRYMTGGGSGVVGWAEIELTRLQDVCNSIRHDGQLGHAS